MTYSVWFNSEATRVKVFGVTIGHYGPHGYWMRVCGGFPSREAANKWIDDNGKNRDHYKVCMGG